MHHFQPRNGQLFAEDVALSDIAARHGTPTYVYSRATLERHFRVMDEAFGARPHTVCFAVKANPSLGVLQVLGALGAGADVVSGGELFRALKAGIPASRIVYSGVGKTDAEMEQGLRAGIRSFHVESAAEMEALHAVAKRLGLKAPVSLRVNPDVDAATHPYISTGLRTSKFGVPARDARALYAHAARLDGLRIHGVASHIGSQITSIAPIAEAARRLVQLAGDLVADGHAIAEIDFGGGLGIAYKDEAPPSPADYARAILDAVGDAPFHVVVEPGRVIAGNAGVLLGRVLYVKDTPEKTFVITDVGMNDAIRPALYGAHHAVAPVNTPAANARWTSVDVVGPVCESADFIARDRMLPAFAPGDLFCVMGAGAYGASMSSNYNSRPRAAELMVDGATVHVLRERETHEDLVRHERPLPSPTAFHDGGSKMTKFQGAFTALVTPFKDGALDLDALDDVVNHQLRMGVHGLVPCGTTGEAAALTHEEHVAVVSRVVKTVNGRVPVIAGVGSPATARSVELAKACANAGVDGLLAVTPYYVKPNAAGQVAHFTAIAKSTGLPVILYNVPGRTGVDMPAEVVLELAQVPNIAGLKDASGNLQRMHEMLGKVPSSFSMLSGEDGLILPTLAVGGHGVISVITHVCGDAVAKMCNAWFAGDVKEAQRQAAVTLPFARLMFMDTSPGPVKTALAAMGLVREEWRLPLGPMAAAKKESLLAELKKLGVELKHGA